MHVSICIADQDTSVSGMCLYTVPVWEENVDNKESRRNVCLSEAV